MATAPSLFGANPEDIQQQRAATLNAEALQYAQLDPFQRATMGIYQGANQLGGAIGGMLGGQDPQLQKAAALKQLASQFDTTTPQGWGEFARALNKAGFNQEAMQAAQASQAGLQQSAELGKTQAELGKLNTAAERETLFRNELAKLGPAPTQEAILAATVKYGSPDRVLAVVQGASDKEAARAQALELSRVNADARVEAAREAGANRLQIAQIAADSRAQIAQLTASLKGPSASDLKRQDAIDKAVEGKAGLADTISAAKGLVKTLGESGGMSSTSSSSLANLLTKGQTSAAGQWLGQATGTENQKNRDVLASTRLQLLNDIKSATGMSSTQLNSNMELQTWLNSLGSPGSTVEANQAILDTLSNRYLKKQTPSVPSAGGSSGGWGIVRKQ